MARTLTPDAPRGTRHTIAPLTADGPTLADVRRAVRDRMAAERIAADAIAARKPNATDGHSDGVRVRYVRAETMAAVLADVLAMLDGAAS